MNVLVPSIFAFLGAGLGAFGSAWTTRIATRSEREARRREEWGRRFTTALERYTSSDPVARTAGQALLEQLLASPLATQEDRLEAEVVLAAVAVSGESGLRLLEDDSDVDGIVIVRKDGEAATDDRGKHE